MRDKADAGDECEERGKGVGGLQGAESVWECGRGGRLRVKSVFECVCGCVSDKGEW